MRVTGQPNDLYFSIGLQLQQKEHNLLLQRKLGFSRVETQVPNKSQNMKENKNATSNQILQGHVNTISFLWAISSYEGIFGLEIINGSREILSFTF